MLLLYLKNGKCKISIIVFITEKICSWLSPWLAEEMEMLSDYGRVTAENILGFIFDIIPLYNCPFLRMYIFILEVVILFNSWLGF